MSRMAAVLLAAAFLAACATGGRKGEPAAVSYDALMSTAESQVTASRFTEALGTFEAAAKADPTRKEPWIRLAQLNFDTGHFGRAIVAAEEALQRDPTDKVAESVLTVGGFRVAAQSLQRLQSSGALTGDAAQREARQLVSAMRDTMGSEILADPDAPKPQTRPAPRRRAAAPAASSPAPASATTPAAKPATANPFDKLGRD